MTRLQHIMKDIHSAALASGVIAFLLEALFPGYITLIMPLDFFVWVVILTAVLCLAANYRINNDYRV